MTCSRRLVLVVVLGFSAGCAPAPPASSSVRVRAAHEKKIATAYFTLGMVGALGGSGQILFAGLYSLPGAPPGSYWPRVGAACAVGGIVTLLVTSILFRHADEHEAAAAAIFSGP
jgi:hypothetical protein